MVATRRTIPSPRGRRAGKLWGFLLLALFVLGQGYSIVHHSVVEHHACPVDGQLAHGEHEHGLAAHEGAQVEDSDDGLPGPTVAPGGDAVEHGDHCSIGDPREQRTFSLPAIAVRVQPPPCSARSAPPPTRTAERRFPVFGLAPKQSPPRVA